jgi:hypothetical protein
MKRVVVKKVARQGFMAHFWNMLGRDQHLADLRTACRQRYNRDLIVRVLAVCLIPDQRACAMLPNGVEDVYAAYFLALAGPAANRASLNAQGCENIYAALLGGPDRFSRASWGETVTNTIRMHGDDRPESVAAPGHSGSHLHALYVLVEMAPFGDTSTTSANAQRQLARLHEFHCRCGFGDAELEDIHTFNSFQNFNFWSEVEDVQGDMHAGGYAVFGKKGTCEGNETTNWARTVLHRSNLESEWSEHDVPAVYNMYGTGPPGPRGASNMRYWPGRTTAIVRFPYCPPGVANAYAHLPNMRRGH